MRILRSILLGAIFSLSAKAEPLTVASLNTVLSDIAKNVGGDHVCVEWIVKPGMDPHAFQPTPAAIKLISDAQIVLASGKGLEGYLAKLEQSAGRGTRFVTIGESIPSLKLEATDSAEHSHDTGDSHGGLVEDPHWWHSVKNAKIATRVIRDAFIAADPAHSETYRKNAAEYQAQLDALSKWIRAQVALLPSEQRKLVTSHDAFQYFARENGFKIFAVEGLSTADQPTSHQVADLIQAIRSQQVKAVFAESSVNPKVVREITQETGAQLGGELLADGLTESATSYEAMMKSNVTTIVNALK